MALGCAMGGLGALLLKTQFLFGDLVCEAGMILAVGYSSYLAADAAGLSGIVAIIFCAMVGWVCGDMGQVGRKWALEVACEDIPQTSRGPMALPLNASQAFYRLL